MPRILFSSLCQMPFLSPSCCISEAGEGGRRRKAPAEKEDGKGREEGVRKKRKGSETHCSKTYPPSNGKDSFQRKCKRKVDKRLRMSSFYNIEYYSKSP